MHAQQIMLGCLAAKSFQPSGRHLAGRSSSWCKSRLFLRHASFFPRVLSSQDDRCLQRVRDAWLNAFSEPLGLGCDSVGAVAGRVQCVRTMSPAVGDGDVMNSVESA